MRNSTKQQHEKQHEFKNSMKNNMNSMLTNPTLLKGIISSLPILSIDNMIKHTLRKGPVENLVER